MPATVINVILVLAGSAAGLLFKNLISERLTCVLTHRSEQHTSELQSRYSLSYAVFCLKKKR